MTSQNVFSGPLSTSVSGRSGDKLPALAESLRTLGSGKLGADSKVSRWAGGFGNDSGASNVSAAALLHLRESYSK